MGWVWGVKIPIASGIPGAYSALWYELALFPIEGEVGKSVQDAFLVLPPVLSPQNLLVHLGKVGSAEGFK